MKNVKGEKNSYINQGSQCKFFYQRQKKIGLKKAYPYNAVKAKMLTKV